MVSPWNRNWPEQLGQIKANMSLVMGHPAVAGWYVCDDCSGTGPVARNLSLAVRQLREHDPYHLFYGAGGSNGW